MVALKSAGYKPPVETKGREELDVPLKMERLKQWCLDVNQIQDKVHYDYVYVDEANFKNYRPRNFEGLINAFHQYKNITED